MVLKKFLVIGLLLLGIAAAAVLLFYAGDHDDEYRNSAPPAGHPLPVENSLPHRGSQLIQSACNHSAFSLRLNRVLDGQASPTWSASMFERHSPECPITADCPAATLSVRRATKQKL